MDWWAFFFSFRGRINRAKYWLALLIFSIVGAVQGLGGLAFGDRSALKSGVSDRNLSATRDDSAHTA